MPELAIGTIFSRNYLPQAMCLAESLRRFHPDILLFGLLIDHTGEGVDPSKLPFPCLDAKEIGVPFAQATSRPDHLLEIAVRAKPFLLEHLLDREFRQVLFLDPDMLILHQLDELLLLLSQHSLVLTPHLLAPPTGNNRWDRELNILVSGIYNGGCLGVSESSTARSFLLWFKERLLWNCRHATGEGVYYDQRWLDLVPAHFPEVHLCRHSGVNVAYWNLAERELSQAGGQILANGEPCLCFHFSGFDPDQPDRPSKHAPGLTLPESGVARSLYAHYAQRLKAAVSRPITSEPRLELDLSESLASSVTCPKKLLVASDNCYDW